MTSFTTESWLWFGIVTVMVLLRFTSRMLHFKSFFRFQIEDYLMIYVACAYTTFIVLINIGMDMNTNLIDPSDIPNLTPEDIAQRTYGSKVILGVEQTMCMVQWGTKACLLFLYYRLTENLVQNIFVKGVGIYVTTTFVVMEILYLGYWCRPFSDYWKTPTDNIQCTTALHHLIVNLSFNLTSDLLIMSIPLPLLLRTHLEIKRKILICFPFTLGFFSIICAVLSKYFSFTHPFSPVWSFWYTREASCVMIVANMPYTWGLARRVFKLKSFWGRGSSESETNSINDAQARDNGMAILGGEVQEIRGLEFNSDHEVNPNGSDKSKSGWSRISSKFRSDGRLNQSAPQIIEIKEVSEKASPTSTQSDKSGVDEPWKNVEWNKRNTEIEVLQVPAIRSPVTPDLLRPPSPASFGASMQRTSTVESRRANAVDMRRVSTYNSRRTRASISEASRRSTRNSVNVDAIDRLYRLDDEGLEADLEAARPRSQCTSYD